ncbi:MAG: sodium:solute symporter [Bacteroidales bacterium]|nr:sodium:solute symporter [Bacteroidales bacterium]MCL2132964.1 sodium:solute symporter [Bacteroidales bacterium]
MSASLLAIVFIAYTLLIFAVTWVTSRRATNDTYFIGNRRSPWFVVAYGMIGASLSGVTFMSVPGNVQTQGFYYMPMVLGFFVGYLIIATVLMPLYYRMQLTSIYGYLERRFGFFTYKSGASFFILSRTLGATLRMFLVVSVLHTFILKQFGVPFWVAGLIFVMLIILYTFEGGIKTIVWTDMLQTTFMLLAVIFCIITISREMEWNLPEMMSQISSSGYMKWIDTDWSSKTHFLKQFLSGVFVCVAMTGLDQEMMQKNLSCRNLKDAKKNMFTFSSIIVVVNFLFLSLGAVLALYIQQKGLHFADTDLIFPTVAFEHLGSIAGLIFIIGLISAAYPSADGALTSLTTSFCIDIIGLEKKTAWTEQKKKKVRYSIHLLFALVFLLLIIFYNAVKNDAIINLVYTVAAYTYGPLLGFFFFGILTKHQVRDIYMPVIAIASPVLCYVLDLVCTQYLNFGFGFTLLIVNGGLTYAGMYLFRSKIK